MSVDSPLAVLSKLWDVLKERAQEDPEFQALLQNGAAALQQLVAASLQSSEVTTPTDAASRANDLYSAYYQPPGGDLAATPYQDGEPLEPAFDTPVRRFDVEPSFADVVNGLTLKARASAWLAEHGYVRDPDLLVERDSLLAQARQHAIHLWNLNQAYVDTQASEVHGRLAACFANTAAALLQWQEAFAAADKRGAANLLAEAQSALRVAVNDAYQGDKPRYFDSQQHAAFRTLKAYADAENVRLAYMSLDDAASPYNHEYLNERIKAFELQSEAKRAAQKQHLKLLRALRHHVNQFGAAQDPDYDGRRITELVRDFSEQFSNRDPELRTLLQPLATAGLDSVDAILTSDPEAFEASEDAGYTDEVTEVRERLAGGCLLLIGGAPKTEAQNRLEQAFGCTVVWPVARHSASIGEYEALVARAEVRLAVQLIRFSSHSHGDIKAFCDHYDKPFVRVTGGYHPNTLASSILKQAGARLAKVA